MRDWRSALADYVHKARATSDKELLACVGTGADGDSETIVFKCEPSTNTGSSGHMFNISVEPNDSAEWSQCTLPKPDARPFELPIWFDCTDSSVISTGRKQRRQAIRRIGRLSADGNHSFNSTSSAGANLFGNLYHVLIPLQSCKRIFQSDLVHVRAADAA
jgi:hypothetical protein